MRQYDYREKWKKLLTPEIVSYIAQIHEFKGEQKLFVEAKTDAPDSVIHCCLCKDRISSCFQLLS